MSETEDAAELLFFDTFSHEVDTDINLDLVQFPKPVYITQVRIIPLGARVQADFPGGVRLGATNPSKFDIEFFVNDLGMQGASTFENLGHLQYNQNDCIHLECTQERIPTDGLVLRGWYSTITLAVYGILTNSMNEPIASPPPPPCEPTTSEEICNLNGDTRNSNAAEDSVKEDWKEPHKTRTSDYDREELDYTLIREHFHHSGDERERERRIRKSSRSSERSGSSRNCTHSESNETDFVRSRSDRDPVKSTREWSRSPDYGRHSRRKRSERSRSDAEDTLKWPRTPPASIDSPARPRSPDNVEYVDEERHYKLKSRPFMHSNESLTQNIQDTIIEDDDTPGTPGEQFEPILSEDEIIGDDNSMTTVEQTDDFDMEIDVASLTENAIIEFDAFKMPIIKFECNLFVRYKKELENLRILFKKFELQSKCNSLIAFKDAATTIDERENFVFLCEQFINQLTYLSQSFQRRSFVLQQFFESDPRNLQQAFSILQIGLDFETACLQPQPAFKIRHIKVGAKLTELLGVSKEFFHYMINEQQFDPFDAIFRLYHQNFMALSIKLMLLKAIYALLDTKSAIYQFLGGKLNGYQLVLEALQQSHLTRTKYALQAIIKKLNMYEALDYLRETCTKLYVFDYYKNTNSNEAMEVIEQCIEQVLDALVLNPFSYQQPRRFLPVSKKFEIVTDTTAQKSFANAIQSFLVQTSTANSLLLLLTNAANLPPSLVLRTLDLLQALLQTNVGVDYFTDDCFPITQMILAALLGVDEVPPEHLLEGDRKTEKAIGKEESTREHPATIGSAECHENSEEKKVINESVADNKLSSLSVNIEENIIKPQKPMLLHRFHKLGIELFYKIQTRYHLDAIIMNASSSDYDPIKQTTHLHAVYSQTCNPVGRQHTIEVIEMNNNLQIFMELIKKEQRLQTQRQQASPGIKCKSPVLSYAVDIVDCCVRYNEDLEYLTEHGANILELAKNHESFEPSVSAVLQEMFAYLKPLELINIFTYDDITPLVEIITRSLEYVTTFPGDLIMGLRILRHLAIGPLKKPFQNAHTEELKHRFVTLKFYACDGVQILVQVLERLCIYFEQPGLHTPAFMSAQGVLCCQIILPTLQILREMLSFAIQSRDVEFKDLTAIDYLMKTYFLLYYYPESSQVSDAVQLAKREIILTLLTYTQPNVQDEESLHKSLWTQMIREILKNIDGPSTFIPGLQVLAELLPLPLPIPISNVKQLPEGQAQRLITERKLWSAHLHPQSSQIVKLIEMLAPSSFPQLTHLLTTVCLQLADLAPNMTLLISKTIIDLLCTEWLSASNTPTTLLARLLQFFSHLTVHASLKSSALSILSGKLWEIFHTILTTPSEPNSVPLKCQVHIHRILESFLDSNISLIAPQSTSNPELNLASALPPKELIPLIIEAIFINVVSSELSHEGLILGIQNLTTLTEHDITFYHLSVLLSIKSTDFQQWILKLVEANENCHYNPNIESLLLFLRSLTQFEGNGQHDDTVPQRSLKLSSVELINLIGFEKNTNPHILQRIRLIFERNAVSNETLLTHINNLITQLESADNKMTEIDAEIVMTEPTLPQAESIVMQYVARPIFTKYEQPNTDQFAPGHWLNVLNIDNLKAEDFEMKFKRVPCDLTELASACLPPDTNLTTDCKRFLNLSASPQSNRERTPTAPCFRTRRVEVEPSTGRPEKKIYITPVRGRGFTRAPPSRSDLFRSRPPNTSRPPSLHVDDFLALETCGAQPTGPTGYNKIPPLMRGSRVGRNRGSRISGIGTYSRKPKALRTSSPSWGDGGSPHYRAASVSETHFAGDTHYGSMHFGLRGRGRIRFR